MPSNENPPKWTENILNVAENCAIVAQRKAEEMDLDDLIAYVKSDLANLYTQCDESFDLALGDVLRPDESQEGWDLNPLDQ